MTASISDVSAKEFDYIIVGGGTAGLTLANRLSEDLNVSVLVLEAGEANLNDDVLLIPGQRMKQFGNPKYDWTFKTVPQPYSNDRAYVWPRGKTLGGSSAINFLLWNKPAKEHIDAIERLGNPGWNWELFDKYSKRVEKFTPPDHDLDILTYDIAHRGESGPLHVSFARVLSGVERPLHKAFKKLGIPVVLEPSGGATNGVSVTAATVDPVTHHRSYAANMYYQPVASRTNLTVLASAHVTEINTQKNDDDTVTATGVTFLYEGLAYEVKAIKEVLLCAGAVMSPQILELSGIGNREILEKAGIEVKVELPGVGENIQEHLWTGLIYEVKEKVIEGRQVSTYDSLMYPEEAAKNFALFPSGEGVLNMAAVSLTFVPLETVSPGATELHKTLAETIRAGIAQGKYPPGLRKQYEIQLKSIEEQVPNMEIMLAPGPVGPPGVMDPNRKHISLCFGLNTPFSRGSIHIGSSDPLVYPTIDPHIFEEPYDLASVVEVVKFNRKLVKTEPLKSVLVEQEVSPGPNVETDEQIADWLRDKIATTFHTVGSCSMLPLEDGGVVDPKLKVYYTTNIRVVDLSVIPIQVGSHTQALAYALAEQAADIIKGVI